MSAKERLGNNLHRLAVAITTPCDALLLAAADGGAGLGDAPLKALFPHGLNKLLKVGKGQLLLHLSCGMRCHSGVLQLHMARQQTASCGHSNS